MLNLSFRNQQFSRAYYDAAKFSEKFYGMNDLITHSNITPADFRDLFPLMVFDVSKQSERLKSSVVDVQIKATFNAAVPPTQKHLQLLFRTECSSSNLTLRRCLSYTEVFFKKYEIEFCINSFFFNI